MYLKIILSSSLIWKTCVTVQLDLRVVQYEHETDLSRYRKNLFRFNYRGYLPFFSLSFSLSLSLSLSVFFTKDSFHVWKENVDLPVCRYRQAKSFQGGSGKKRRLWNVYQWPSRVSYTGFLKSVFVPTNRPATNLSLSHECSRIKLMAARQNLKKIKKKKKKKKKDDCSR